jgi:hypothetical protein
MSRRRLSEEEYIQFLIGSATQFSAVEGARVHPSGISHDSITRLLQWGESDNEDLWVEACGHVERDAGVLVVDDSTLDKFYQDPRAVHQLYALLVGGEASGKSGSRFSRFLFDFRCTA